MMWHEWNEAAFVCQVTSTHPECSIVLHLREKETECKLKISAAASRSSSNTTTGRLQRQTKLYIYIYRYIFEWMDEGFFLQVVWCSGTEWAAGRLPLKDRSSPSSVLCCCWSLKLLQVNIITCQTQRKEREIKSIWILRSTLKVHVFCFGGRNINQKRKTQ